jgi:hypothetical protein
VIPQNAIRVEADPNDAPSLDEMPPANDNQAVLRMRVDPSTNQALTAPLPCEDGDELDPLIAELIAAIASSAVRRENRLRGGNYE